MFRRPHFGRQPVGWAANWPLRPPHSRVAEARWAIRRSNNGMRRRRHFCFNSNICRRISSIRLAALPAEEQCLPPAAEAAPEEARKRRLVCQLSHFRRPSNNIPSEVHS